MALLMVPPTSADGDGSLTEYVIVDLLPAALLLAAPWLPGTSTAVLTGFALAVILGMPVPGNISTELLGLVLLGTHTGTAALLIAFGRWRTGALAFASNIVLSAIFTLQEAGLAFADVLFFTAELFPSIALGIAFLYFERTFQRRRREIAAAAAAHQRELDRQHDAIIQNTHDVVSHTFSAARSLTAIQQSSADPEEKRGIEAELSVVLAAGEENFRQYILRMRTGPSETNDVDFPSAFSHWCERLAATMSLSRHPTTFHLQDLPQAHDAAFFTDATLLTQEICTNIIRHCPEGAASTVRGHGSAGVLVLRVENAVRPETQVTPDFATSLRKRVEQRGGAAEFKVVEGQEGPVLRTTLTLQVADCAGDNHPDG